MNKIFSIISILLTIGISLRCSSPNRPTESYLLTGDSCVADDYRPVNIAALIDSVGQYNGLRVEVVGYFQSSIEESALSEHQAGDTQMLWVGLVPKLAVVLLKSPADYDKIGKKKILIRGIVDTSSHGHLGQYKAEIKEVCYIKKTE